MEELDRREVTSANGKKAVIVVEEHVGPPGPHISESEYHESAAEEHQIMSHSLPSVATLCNSAIGAGVLSLPFAFKNTGKSSGYSYIGIAAYYEPPNPSGIPERFTCLPIEIIFF
jgi:hypothetical protein